MLNLASSMTVVTSGSETSVQPDRSTKELTDRFSALIDDAEGRVRVMQTIAITEFTKREQRFVQFAAAQKRLKRIISDRLGVLTSQSVFSDAQLTYSDGVGCTAGVRSNGSTTTITLPISASRHKQMEFAFHVFHDTDIENAVVEYRLQILPVFVKFVAHDQLIVSIDGQSDADSVAWVDAKLVGFVETYFDIFFHPEYQKLHMVTDPVLGTQFPRSMASASQDLNGRTFHFCTYESCRLFNENSSYYLGTLFGSTVEPGCMAPVSHSNES